MRAALLRPLVVAAATCVAVTATPQTLGRLTVVTGGIHSYTTVRGDTLRSIGARFGVDATTLATGNQLDGAARLATGRLLRIDNRHIVPAGLETGSLLVNVPQRMLFIDHEDGVSGFPVAVGRRDWQTPIASFTIVTAEENPTWDVPVSIQEEARRAGRALPAKVPPGPANPLGGFWLGLSVGGVGIHGTNAPPSIYGAVTHGCIRARPDDIAWLFPRVKVGTRGRIVYEPVLLAVAGEEILLEAHRDVYRRARLDPRADARALADALGVTAWIDWEAADDVLTGRLGIARPVARAGFSTAAPSDHKRHGLRMSADLASISEAGTCRGLP